MNSPIKLPEGTYFSDANPSGPWFDADDMNAYAEQAVRDALASAPADERELRAAAQATCDALKNVTRFTVKSIDDRNALVAARARLRAALASAPPKENNHEQK